MLSTWLARDGSVLLVEQGRASVRRVDRTGKEIASYGRAGGGPGELRFPYRIVELSDGAVLVYDLASHRFSEFSADGKFRRQSATSANVVTLDKIVPLEGRGFAVAGIVRDPRSTQHAIHVFDSAFVLRRSFGQLPTVRSRVVVEMWGAGDLARSADGTLLFSRRIPYELSVFSIDGSLVRRISPPLRVSGAADDAFRITSKGGTTTTSVNQAASFPGTVLPLPDGRILSGRVVEGQPYWDVISRDGRVMWSGPQPKRLSWCFGVDESHREMWCVGDRDDVPVLFRVGLS